MIDVRCAAYGLLAAGALLLAACPGDSGADGEDREAPAEPATHTAIATPSDDVPLLVPPMFQCKPVKSDDSVDQNQFPVPPPPFSAGVFPCTRCHDKPDDFNTTPRTLTLQHTNIKLNHGPREQWCYDCHNPSNRDKLRLAGGRLISFDESYLLCGQCHGDKLRDWRLGIHGRRTGCWNGQREYLLCVNCHNQHSPRFAPIHPKPRPKTPSEIQLPEPAGGAP